MRICWCGNTGLFAFSPEYGECRTCGTVVFLKDMPPEQFLVRDDETDFYGKKYWLEHQKEAFGYDNIHARSRSDLTGRNLHWLKALLKYRLPPARVLELGCSHGSFVALLCQAGYDASGVEMSPWVVEFGQKTFGVPISLGPAESIEIPPGSLDVIALMDVLEHLPDPVSTMTHCLKLLKPDGLLLIQTPQFKQGMDYRELTESGADFLQQLKADEHLYLFSERSATRLFQHIGANHIQFEPAIFGHYDMFFTVSRAPFKARTRDQIELALLASPNGRIAMALLDLFERESMLTSILRESEADSAARLTQIETLTRMLKETEADSAARLTQIETLTKMLKETEADSTARLIQIETLTRMLKEAEADCAVKCEKTETLAADLRALFARRSFRLLIKFTGWPELKQLAERIEISNE